MILIKFKEEFHLNEITFNKLFDRKIDHADFLRGRVAGYIPNISKDMLENPAISYNKTFYSSTIKYNDFVVEKYGNDFLLQSKQELCTFEKYLDDILNTSNKKEFLKKTNYKSYLHNFTKLTRWVGWYNRSRIIRRYNNFMKVCDNFVCGKLDSKNYTAELQNHSSFFNEFITKINGVNAEDILIYYMVYDIKAADGVKKLKRM